MTTLVEDDGTANDQDSDKTGDRCGAWWAFLVCSDSPDASGATTLTTPASRRAPAAKDIPNTPGARAKL